MGTPPSPAAPYSDGRLHSRPGHPPSMEPLAPGVHHLSFPNGRSALFHAPAHPGHPLPLLVMLHGAGRLYGGGDQIVLAHATRLGACVVLPRAAGASWDAVRDHFGPDLEFIDRLLHWTFHRYPIAVDALSIAGFSDGASYALSVGMMNGDLFHDILAFSPGFARPLRRVGLPRVFVAHGVDDKMLSVERGRMISNQLANEGYPVQYEEFDGAHLVSPEVAAPVLQRVLSIA